MMKKLCLILLIIIPAICQAQYDSTKNLQTVLAYGNSVANHKVRGMNGLPMDTFKLAVRDSGAIAYKGGHVWKYNGYFWSKIGSVDDAYISGSVINDSTLRLYKGSGDSSTFLIKGSSGGGADSSLYATQYYVKSNAIPITGTDGISGPVTGDIEMLADGNITLKQSVANGFNHELKFNAESEDFQLRSRNSDFSQSAVIAFSGESLNISSSSNSIGIAATGASPKGLQGYTYYGFKDPLTYTQKHDIDLYADSLRNEIADSMGTTLQSVVAGTNVTVDNTDPRNPVISATGGGSSDTLYFRPETYGAARDGVQDDGPAFNAMIAAMPQGGRVMLSAGKYLINTTVTVNKSIAFEGTNMGDSADASLSTMIISTSTTAIIFDVKENFCAFRDFTIKNMATTHPTAGAAFAFSGNTRTSTYILGYSIDRVSVFGFYDNVSSTNACQFGITNSLFWRPVRFGIDISCTSVPDAGDSYITGNNFMPKVGTSVAAINQTGSGGLRTQNNKFNALPAYAGRFEYMYLANLAGSSIIVFDGNSVENYGRSGVVVSNAGFPVITDNQFSGYGNTETDMRITSSTKGSVIGNTFQGTPGVDSAITIVSSSDFNVMNTYYDYNTPVRNITPTGKILFISQSGLNASSTTGSFSIDESGVTSANTSTVSNTLELEADDISAIFRAYGSTFPVASLQNKVGVGPGSANTDGVVISSNSSSPSGAAGSISLRGGGYDTGAEKIYIDKDSVKITGEVKFTGASAGNLQTLSDGTVRVYATPRQTVQALTDGATITMDLNNGSVGTVTLGGNRTLAFSNLAVGQHFQINVTQDGAGGRTLTLPGGTKVINGGAGAVTLSAAGGSIDILTFFYDGSTLYCNYGKNYN